MKRICSLLLAAWILLISASALAAYEQYHLTEPCELYADGYINVYPLDPHEVIVRMTPPEAPKMTAAPVPVPSGPDAYGGR